MPKIDPSIDIIKNFRTPLNDGERRVLNYLYKNLPEEWEIYVQPPMNSLNPDIILLHPNNGIVVIEVKDWSNEDGYWHDNETGPLFRKGKEGKKHVVRPHPIDKINYYRTEMKDNLLPSASTDKHFGIFHAVLVFSSWNRKKLNDVFSKNTLANKDFDFPGKSILRCGDDLLEMSISDFLPCANIKHGFMNTQIAEELRHQVSSSEFDKEQTRFVRLNNDQSRLVFSRTKGGYRRIKGAAGTGKSVVLAARAAELQRDEKKTYIIFYNITLGNYLRDLAVRYDNKAGKEIGYFHYHGLLRYIYLELGELDRWNALFDSKSSREIDEILEEVVTNDFVEMLEEVAQEDPNAVDKLKLDAILVDEGQDFNINWWNSLKPLLKDNGEMILAADPTQDMYDKTKAWTDESMTGAGFSGNWVNLAESYRMPSTLQSKTNDFASKFLPTKSEKILASKQLEFLDFEPAILNWKQIEEKEAVTQIVSTIKNRTLNKQISKLGLSELSMKDIVILVPTNDIGRKVVSELTKDGIKVAHTFHANDKMQKHYKRHFYKGAHQIKATTINSYKGLESRALIVYTDAQKDEKDYHSVYAALTRLKGIPEGSILQVYCSDNKLREYGRTWQGQALHRQMNPTVKIKENQIGITYEHLFGECIAGSDRLVIQDGYILTVEQLLNLSTFIETYREAQDDDKAELQLHLKTRNPTLSSQNNFKERPNLKKLIYEHEDALMKLQKWAKIEHNIIFTWEKDQTIHDRSIQTNNGWFITLGRGLDIFKKNDDTSKHQELPCRECIITFRKEH